MANVPITSLPEATAPSANDYLILQGENTKRIKWSVLLDKLYPVGCIYQSASSTSPASLFGGTWEQIKDRFILAAGDTYAAGSMGGEATHILTISEMPTHKHSIVSSGGTPLTTGFFGFTITNEVTGYVDANVALETGGSSPHNNMPPYAAMYVWKRIA